jgi:RND family efflux transporter MFP subunit
MRRALSIAAVLAVLGGGAAYMAGLLPLGQSAVKAAAPVKEAPRPAVSVAAASQSAFIDSVLVTGSLVARQEILVAPEVEGLRVVALGAEEGDRVAAGASLARLEQETLEAQLAQNAAALARATAAIAQAGSQIAQAEARLTEARANFERAQPLKKSGALSEAVYDQREAAARTAQAQLTAARDGLKLAEAERGQIEAQRREITWRMSRTDVRAPVDGLVSRRTARIGAMASGAAAEPMFRMAERGEIELDAEVPEADMARLAVGQTARIQVAGSGEVEGRVRLVSAEVDKQTRLGKVRIFLGNNQTLRIGAFGRGHVQVAASRGLAIPASAVAFTGETANVLVVDGDTVRQRRVKVGLMAGDQAEILDGLAEGDRVVARAGTFLRDGDQVRPVAIGADKMSEAR